MQHKVDELRSLGYGRLTYSELRSAGVIDGTPSAPPYRFEATDQLSDVLSNPVGTITFTQVGTDLIQAKVRLDWRRVPYKGTVSTHEITILIANE